MQPKKLFDYTTLLIVPVLFATALLFALKPSVTQVENQTGAVISSVVVTTEPTMATTTVVVAPTPLFHYIEIIDGCGPYYNVGTCMNLRLGPGTEFPTAGHLRTGVTLRVQGRKYTARDGSLWYKVIQDQELRHPDRVTGDWYVAVDAEVVRPFDDMGDQRLTIDMEVKTTKHIVVNLSEEMLYAYDGDKLFMMEPVSPGLIDTPTPRGKFTVYYKTPSRYMQGPILGVSEQEYDLPGVPWNLYFTPEGAVIHGAYWHDNFGKKWSHGCVNMAPKSAEKLYNWAPLGITVVVKD